MVEGTAILQYYSTTRAVVQEAGVPDIRIVSDSNIMMDKPVVAGTPITVEFILEKLSAGEYIEQILGSHPTLTREGVQAAISTPRTACVPPLFLQSTHSLTYLAEESIDRAIVYSLREAG
jgi:uncharacterized protein (DUF433 family)